VVADAYLCPNCDPLCSECEASLAHVADRFEPDQERPTWDQDPAWEEAERRARGS
jgi:hypothetical protein